MIPGAGSDEPDDVWVRPHRLHDLHLLHHVHHIGVSVALLQHLQCTMCKGNAVYHIHIILPHLVSSCDYLANFYPQTNISAV